MYITIMLLVVIFISSIVLMSSKNSETRGLCALISTVALIGATINVAVHESLKYTARSHLALVSSFQVDYNTTKANKLLTEYQMADVVSKAMTYNIQTERYKNIMNSNNPVAKSYYPEVIINKMKRIEL